MMVTSFSSPHGSILRAEMRSLLLLIAVMLLAAAPLVVAVGAQAVAPTDAYGKHMPMLMSNLRRQVSSYQYIWPPEGPSLPR